jgi:hypothetical protein
MVVPVYNLSNLEDGGRRLRVCGQPRQKWRPYLKNKLEAKGLEYCLIEWLPNKHEAHHQPENKTKQNTSFWGIKFFSSFIKVYLTNKIA